jgi:hypothetical protein
VTGGENRPESQTDASKYWQAPPLGLMPRRQWLWHRVRDIVTAMQRYIDAGKDIPTDWAVDLQLICHELEQEKPVQNGEGG